MKIATERGHGDGDGVSMLDGEVPDEDDGDIVQRVQGDFWREQSCSCIERGIMTENSPCCDNDAVSRGRSCSRRLRLQLFILFVGEFKLWDCHGIELGRKDPDGNQPQRQRL